MDSAFINENAGQTVLNPLGLMMAVLLGFLIFVVPRSHVIWPFLIMSCFVSQAQRIYVAGMNFDLIRVLLICTAIRVFMNGETAWFRWTRLDSVVMLWGLAMVAMPIIRLGPNLIVNRLGAGFDTFGMYFLFRTVIRGFDDIWVMVKGTMMLSIVVSFFIAAERATGRNVFAIFGGLPEITPIRDGRLRCQGAFSHSILAGSFWAGALPLFLFGWLRREKKLTIAACVAACFMIVASASATPISSLIVATAGAACFRIRTHMRKVRWLILLTLVVLHLVMKAPVWHLIARMGSLGGSAWHRFALVDGCITHVDEWWALGSTVGTAHWGHFTFDVANFYIVQAIQGGFIQLGLFVLVIGTAFGCVGRVWRACQADKRLVIATWLVGLALLVHALNLFGVSYFGQVWVGWYLTLAIVGSLSQVYLLQPQPHAVGRQVRRRGVSSTRVQERPLASAR